MGSDQSVNVTAVVESVDGQNGSTLGSCSSPWCSVIV